MTQQISFSENTKKKKDLASSRTTFGEKLIFKKNPEGRQHIQKFMMAAAQRPGGQQAKICQFKLVLLGK